MWNYRVTPNIDDNSWSLWRYSDYDQEELVVKESFAVCTQVLEYLKKGADAQGVSGECREVAMAIQERDRPKELTKERSVSTSLEEVLAFRDKMHDRSTALVRKKGHDYNRTQQDGGDTLFNLRVCELLGVVSTAEQGVLVRLSDKLMRLVSLTGEAGVEAQVSDESVLDTVADIHNYVDYLALMWQARKNRDP